MYMISGIQIRHLRVGDWESVRAIYVEGIKTGQATFETREPPWADWNSSHLTNPRLVAIAGQLVVGWAALSPVSSRNIYAGVTEVSVYVAQDSRRKGIGRALLEELVAESERNGIWTLQASIFPENVASLGLHKSCGFRVVGTRERIGRMNDVWRDTQLLERRSKRVGTD